MKLIMENWNKFLNEEKDSLPIEELQKLIDNHDFLSSKNIKVSAENIHKSGDYYLLGTNESFEHMKERHLPGPNSKPGSKFLSKINLLEVIKEILEQPPNDTKDPTRHKWIEVESQEFIGTEQIKQATPEEVAKMKKRTDVEEFKNLNAIPIMQKRGAIITTEQGAALAKQGTPLDKLPIWQQGGGKAYMVERIAVSEGNSENTKKMSFISAIIGKTSDGKFFISPITAFPGGDVVDADGNSITDRNKLAASGYYFVV